MSRLTVALLLAVMLMCAGCARTIPGEGAKWESMVVLVDLPIHQSPSTVAVSALGGHALPPEWAWGNHPPYISDEEFASALRQSIEQSKLFAPALKEGLANYQLQAFMRQLNQHDSWPSEDITVIVKATYTLLRNEPNQIVWRKTLTSTYTVPPSAASLDMTRSRLAAEGAARHNIEQAIQEISQLRLD